MDERDAEVLGLSELVSLGSVAETPKAVEQVTRSTRSRVGAARTSGQLARTVVTFATLQVAVLAYAGGGASARSVELNVSKTARTTPLVERPSDIRYEFARLTKLLKKDTALVSAASDIAAHPAYRRIIELGQPAIPLILADLHNSPTLIGALREITGENPVQREDRGNVSRMIAAWTQWGHARGLLG